MVKAQVVKTKKAGQAGTKALIRCNVCGTTKWIAGSIVRNGYGKFCSKKCQGAYLRTQRMEQSPKWRGGRVKQLGYWMIKQSDGTYKREHIILMEQQIGRKILSNECVHHKNGDRLDNRLDNLQLLTKGDHNKVHAKLYNRPKSYYQNLSRLGVEGRKQKAAKKYLDLFVEGLG